MAGVTPIAPGAEAVLEPAVFLGRVLLCKRRVVKGYRHPVLDARLRRERTRDEANLLAAARRAGVPVPVVYRVDRGAALIHLEHVAGATLKEHLEADGDDAAHARMVHLGRFVARLHDAGLTHGDLTTRNVLVPQPDDPASLVLVDFGLGQATREDEARGVDLHLVEEALEATDARAGTLFVSFLAAYGEAARCAPGAVRRLEAIRERGRNR